MNAGIINGSRLNINGIRRTVVYTFHAHNTILKFDGWHLLYFYPQLKRRCNDNDVRQIFVAKSEKENPFPSPGFQACCFRIEQKLKNKSYEPYKKNSFLNSHHGGDMGAISETLFGSELFGHMKGSFTDAKESSAGKFETASKGTLFLDEIGNLTIGLQANILAAFENRKVTRIGSNTPIPIEEIRQSTVDKTIKGLRVIEERSSGLLKFVDNYRKFTKLPEPDLEEVDLVDLIGKVLLVCSGFNNFSAVQVEEYLPGKLMVTTDENLLSQVLINQIPPEIQEQIFVPFYTTK